MFVPFYCPASSGCLKLKKNKDMNTRRIEFILFTAIFLFVTVLLYANSVNHQVTSNVGYASVIYVTVMGFCLWISPQYFMQRRIDLGIAFTILLFFSTWAGLTLCVWSMGHYGTYWKSASQGESIGGTLLTFFFMFVYEGLKRGIRYINTQNGKRSAQIVKEALVVLGAGLLIFAVLVSYEENLGILWLTSVPYAYLLFAVNTYWLIPKYEKRKIPSNQKLLISFVLSFIFYLPFGVLFLNLTGMTGWLFLICWLSLAIGVVTLSQYLYDLRRGRTMELKNLKIELGQTSADLNFLRSQINPHFLFNVMNTLYGTALQENAERTSGGIQKLSDMMRFMLHENNQDKILLVREIEYLRNYIDLQLLRTVNSPDIIVESNIKETLSELYIVPMLLIPFVENAFKHGISFNQPSWIKLSLKESDGTLFFDVYNSLHLKYDADPEKKYSGVGLENVKHRLALLYPGRHELVIRKTEQEYFVHLTIQLDN